MKFFLFMGLSVCVGILSASLASAQAPGPLAWPGAVTAVDTAAGQIP